MNILIKNITKTCFKVLSMILENKYLMLKSWTQNYIELFLIS